MMKKLLTKILPCLLVICVIATVASCEKEKPYNYPSVTPTISNPSNAFMTLDNRTITKQAVYNRLVQSYGVTTLVEWLDSVILENAAIDDMDDYNEQMNYIIYGSYNIDDLTEDEKDEKYQEFVDSMLTQGYDTKEKWEAHYILEYKRLENGFEDFKKYVEAYNANEENETPYFTEDNYQSAYSTLYQSDYTVILVTFDSEHEAKKVMRNCGINTDSLTGAWTNLNGVELTSAEIKDAFTNMFNIVGDGSTAEKVYPYDTENYRNELATISSSIVTKVASLTTMEENLNKSYTHAPLVYGTRYYLALKVSETEVIENYEDVTDEDVKKEVENYLYENSLASSYLLLAMTKAHRNAGLKIYDEGLEIAYLNYYNSNFSNAKITDFDAFETTTEENATIVARITVDGKEHTLTADDLYNRLIDRYGPALSLLYLQEYIILKKSTIINQETGTILDQETYDEYYASDITKYKTSLEKGEYATSGYPKNYPWEYFVRDYLGMEKESDLMTAYGGSIYQDAEAAYIKEIYMGEVEYQVDENGNQVLDEDDNPIVTKTADQAVQDEMDNIFNNFFSATMVGVYAYYDADLNGIADEMTTSQETSAKQLVDLVYEMAKDEKYVSISEGLSELVKLYRTASNLPSDNSVWRPYKQLGIRLTLISSTTYTNSSTAPEEVLAVAKEQWQAVKNYKGDDTNKPDPVGQTLDPGYRSVINSEVKYVSSKDFADNSNSFIANNAAYRLVITKATNNTYISTYYKTFKPTLAEYENYLLPSDDENKTSVSSALSTAITTYYIPAINNLASQQIVNNLIYNDCKNAIESNAVQFVNNTELHARVMELIEYSLKNNESE